MIKNDLVIKDCDNYIINKYFKTEVKNNRDYKVELIKISDKQNLSSYILIKRNFESISLSKNRKKSKLHYSEIVFAGLRQPTKDISLDTYKILSLFIKRFKVDNIDICFDGLSELGINKNTYMMYQYLFSDYINSFSDTHLEQTSFYINEPVSPLNDAERFKKILVYNKYLKESRYKYLHSYYENWKRLEFTLNIKFKLKDFTFDDCFEDMQKLAFKYFEIDAVSYKYFEKQLELLTDRRSHKKSVILNENIRE